MELTVKNGEVVDADHDSVDGELCENCMTVGLEAGWNYCPWCGVEQ